MQSSFFGGSNRLTHGIRLQTKLLLSYIILILLPVVCIVVMIVIDISNAAYQQDCIRIQQAFNASLVNADNFFRGYVELAKTLSADQYLTNYLKKRYPQDTTLEKKHFDFVEMNRTYRYRFIYEALDGDNICITTGNDRLLFSMQDSPFRHLTDADLNETWYLQAMKFPKEYSLSVQVPNRWNRTITFAAHLTSGSIVNILKIDIPAENLCNVFDSKNNDRIYYVVNAAGDILASDDVQNIGHSFFDTPYAELRDDFSDLTDIRTRNFGNSIANIGHIGTEYGLNTCYLIEVSAISSLEHAIATTLSHSIPVWMVLLLLDIAMILLFSRGLTRHIRVLVKRVQEVIGGNMNAQFETRGNDEIAELSRYMKTMMERINSLITDVYQADIEVKNAKIRALQSQINPHFLFNCLQAINASALKSGAMETSDMIVSYSRVIRASIQWDSDFIPLQQEMQLVSDYLRIQQTRFGSRFSSVLHVDSDCEELLIPKFCIQPIVENAVVHGVEKVHTPCCVSVTVEGNDDTIAICVDDNGCGIPAERLAQIQENLAAENISAKNAHIGILNVHHRIQLMYGREYGVSLKSAPDMGTHVFIRIPKRIT